MDHICSLKGNCHEQFNLKKTAWTFQVWFKVASMQGKTACIWSLQTKKADSMNEKWPENLACLLKCMHSSWQFPFKVLYIHTSRLRLDSDSIRSNVNAIRLNLDWRPRWAGCYGEIAICFVMFCPKWWMLTVDQSSLSPNPIQVC